MGIDSSEKIPVPEESSYSNEYFLTTDSSDRKTLPPWLDHFNLPDLKILFKCSVAAWIVTLLIVINPTLKAIGQAAFFGILVIFIAPPSGVVFIGVMVGMMLFIGICLGWAWGAITMKIALATRPAADLQRQYQELQEAATRNTTNALQASGQATFQQVAIFEGYMLDTRVTVTYFCLLGLFIYLVARLRVAAPKLALVQMFSIIICDIYLTTGPLIPTFNGTIPRTLIIPAAIGVGVSIICNLLIFPRSTSHIVLEDMVKLLKPMNTLLEACSLHFLTPSRKMNIANLKATKVQLVQKYSEVEQNLKFLALDISVSRWSAGDVKSLHDPLRQVLISFLALAQIHITRLEFQLKDEELLKAAEQGRRDHREQEASGGYQIAKTFDLRSEMRNTISKGPRETALRDFGESSKDVISSCQLALDIATQILQDCNSRGWIGKLFKKEHLNSRQTHNDIVHTLTAHKDQLPAKVASSLQSRYKSGHDTLDATATTAANNVISNSQRYDGVVYVLVMEERIYTYAEAVESLLKRLIALDQDRMKARFWLPGSLGDVIPWALETNNNETDQQPLISKIETSTRSTKGSTKQKRRFWKKEPASGTSIEIVRKTVASPRGGRQRSKGGKITTAVSHWFGSTEGLFALRTLILTIGLGILAVNRTTAGFFYREKGLWALIMAQTGLAPYTADFLYGLVLKGAGTVIGAVIGLAAWYIGAGNGPGNPYGIAAVMAPIIIALMWLRIFGDPALTQGVILMTATTYLVVAYSWVDTHIPSYGNPGVGYTVFWRRMLLVLIGFGAAAFITLFPRPPSANRHYRRVLSNALQTNKDQYALLVACRSSGHNPDDVRKLAGTTAIQLSEVLSPLESEVRLLKFELSSSKFGASSLGLVCHLCMNLNQYITQLMLYSAGLPPDLKERFFTATGAADERAIADIMAVLTLVQYALREGDPLPATLPVPLMERLLNNMKRRLDEMDLDFGNLDQKRLEDHNVRKFLSAMAAYVQFLGSVDELVLVVKRAVGETNHVDLEALNCT